MIIIVPICQQFSTEGNFALPELLAMSGDVLTCQFRKEKAENVLLAFRV